MTLKKVNLLSFFFIISSFNIGVSANTIDLELLQTSVFQFTNLEKGTVDLVDFDNDGNVDLFLTGNDSQNNFKTILYKGLGNNNFMEVNINMPGISSSNVEIFDFNADGKEDVFISGLRQSGQKYSKLYRNNGDLTFTEMSALSSSNRVYNRTEAIDIDNDGDLDIYLNSGRLSYLYLNNGNGSFQQTLFPAPVLDELVITFGDTDNDNDIDFIVCGENTSGFDRIHYFLNNSLGGFTERVNEPFEQVRGGAINLVDIDGDGDKDLTLIGKQGNFGNEARIYKNDGTGSFTTFKSFSVSGSTNLDQHFIDVDSDGDLDRYTVSTANTSFISNYLSKNDGQGNFLNVSSGTSNLDYSDVDFYDVDKDGDLDMFMIGEGPNGPVSKMYLNADTGYFQTQFDLYSFVGHSGTVESADVDNDGDLDLLVSHNNGTILFKNDGSANFTPITNHGIGSSAFGDGKFADFNNDGNVDFIKVTTASTRLYLNDGTGRFTQHPNVNNFGAQDASIDVGDFDNDQRIDYVISGYNSSVGFITRQYRNQLHTGQNTFINVSASNFQGLRRGDVKVGDLDNDNHLDLIVMGSIRVNLNEIRVTRAYYNNGSGVLAFDNTLPFTELSEGGIDLGDIDSDGDLDVVITGNSPNTGSKSTLYQNLGNKSYAVKNSFSGNGFRNGQPKFSDLDNDGDLDLVLVGSGGTSTGNGTIYINDGQGNYTELSRNNLIGLYDGDLMVSDLNNDNYPEIVMMGFNPQAEVALSFYLNKACISDTAISATSCSSYALPSGRVVTETGIYLDTINNNAGCDSILTIDFKVDTINLEVVKDYEKVSSLDTAAAYQWLDCNNGYSVINNATSRVFYPTVNGSYAVELIKNGGCRDTTACYIMSSIGTIEQKTKDFEIFPNPNKGGFEVNFDKVENDIELSVIDIQGKQVFSKQYANAERINISTELPEGIYYLNMLTADHFYTKRFIIIK